MPIKKKCFVIAPIGEDGSLIREHSDFLFDRIIKVVLARDTIKINATRSDKFFAAEMIGERIFSEILHSDLIIADITFHNPNVFYELAVSHFLRKKVIVCKTPGTRIPFDTSNFRTLSIDVDDKSYDNIIKCQSDLEKFIIATLNDEKTPRNPITTALGDYTITISDGEDKTLVINERILESKNTSRSMSQDELTELLARALKVYDTITEAKMNNSEIAWRDIKKE
jgi:hypothetical protein